MERMAIHHIATNPRTSHLFMYSFSAAVKSVGRRSIRTTILPYKILDSYGRDPSQNLHLHEPGQNYRHRFPSPRYITSGG